MRVSAEIIEYQDDDLMYKLNTETQTAELAKFSGSAIEVIIPESVTNDGVTYRVTRWGDWCFKDHFSLKSIDIPSSVNSLGDGCFAECFALTSITIPSSVTSLVIISANRYHCSG